MSYQPIPGQAHNPSDEETMSVIRSVLTEADEAAPSRKAIRAERKAHADAAALGPQGEGEQPRAFVERTPEHTKRRRANDLPDLQDAPTEHAPKVRKSLVPKLGNSVHRHVARLWSPVRDFRPTTRHLALASMALLVALRPHWFVISGVLAVALVVATFLILGSDRIWRMVIAWLTHVEARNPERALRIRDRLDRCACRWDAILDFFPDGMVDSLYMPDLQAMQDADAAHTEAMAARLNQMAHDN